MTRIEMLELSVDDLAAERQLRDAPSDQYLLELVGGWRLLWRLTGDEPADEALEPAITWPWLAAEVA
jgi:hypothetical protein